MRCEWLFILSQGDEDVVPQKPHQGRNHRRGHHSSRASRPPSRRPVEDRSRAEDMNKSWRREDDMEQSWRTAEDVDTSGGEKDTNDTGPAVEEDSTSLDNALLLSDEEGCGIEDGEVVDEVVCGQAAGMPGRWVEVVHEEQQSSSTEELLTALHLKAQAFADNGWQEYWTSAGPSHLAQSWSQQYPSIPLNKVECVCGVDFLCQTMETQMSLNSTVPAAAEEHQNTLESDCPPLDDEEAEPNDHEILAMWNELYNNQYWFIYSWYRGDQPLQQQQDDDTVDMDQQLDQVLTPVSITVACVTMMYLHSNLTLTKSTTAAKLTAGLLTHGWSDQHCSCLSSQFLRQNIKEVPVHGLLTQREGGVQSSSQVRCC